MSRSLHISDTLSLPMDAVTQKLAFLGRTGSGKSYASMKIAEEMLGSGGQVVTLDPVGIWYGLRIASDGKGPGIQIPVFGGLHGDVPIESTGGTLIADLVVDRSLSMVIDVSQFESDAQKARFASDFAARFFFRKKASPSPVMLFLEECQEFIPENPRRDEALMLHHYTRLTKLGRNFGIGMGMISQRPQEVNKKCLNLTECMFAFQMTGPHERKTIKSWVEEKGGDLDIVDALPRFSVGEAHVWSPQWLKISQTVKIGKRWTFNSSSTPAFGSQKQTEPKPLDSADMERVRVAMADTIERAKADDPRELRKTILELQKQLGSKLKPTSITPAPKIDPEALKRAEERGYERSVKQMGHQLRDLQNIMKRFHAQVSGYFENGKAVCESFKVETRDTDSGVSESSSKVHLDERQQAASVSRRVRAPRPTPASDNGDLSGPEHRILDAIAWLESIGVDRPEQVAVAFLAGYTYGGGAFNNPRGSLRSKGLVDYAGESIMLTQEGRKQANYPDGILTTEELHRRILERLPGPEQRILEVLIKAYPDSVENNECARAAGYTPEGGAYNNPRGRLRTLGLIEYPERGHVRARDILWLK